MANTKIIMRDDDHRKIMMEMKNLNIIMPSAGRLERADARPFV